MPWLRVVYKSGAIVDFKCEEATITRSGLGELKKVSWKGADPNPLFIGIDEIAAVWEYGEEKP